MLPKALNSGEHIDYIRSLCQVSINACSLLMADPVVKPVELIPGCRDSFPRRLCCGVSETREVLYGIGFLVRSVARAALHCPDVVFGQLFRKLTKILKRLSGFLLI